MRIRLFQHPHHLNPLPIPHWHRDPPDLPISPHPVKRHSRQSTPHLKPPQTHCNCSALRSVQDQTPKPTPRKFRMHKNSPNLRRIHLRVKHLRLDRLHLVVSPIQRLAKTPSTAPGQLTALIERDKISAIRNQLAVHRKYSSQRAVDLSRRVVPRLQPTHRSVDQRKNPQRILRPRCSQLKFPHARSIEAPPPSCPNAKIASTILSLRTPRTS